MAIELFGRDSETMIEVVLCSATDKLLTYCDIRWKVQCQCRGSRRNLHGMQSILWSESGSFAAVHCNRSLRYPARNPNIVCECLVCFDGGDQCVAERVSRVDRCGHFVT